MSFRKIVMALMLVLPMWLVSAESVQVKKDYSIDEMVQIFKNEGYVVEKVSNRIFVIKINGKKYMMIRYDDGDLQAHYAFGGVKVTCEDMNTWNRDKRLSKAYLDNDGDPVLEADLLSDGGLSKENFTEFFDVFQKSVNSFRVFLLKHDKS